MAETDQETQIRERVDPDTGEVLTTKAIVSQERQVKGVTIGGQQYDVVKRVNLPTLKHESGEIIAFRIDAPIREEKSTKQTEVTINGEKVKGTEETSINVVRVTEASSMREFEYVCNAMTADNLRSAYPSHDYVGKWFAVSKLGQVAGKRYKETHVIEIAPVG